MLNFAKLTEAVLPLPLFGGNNKRDEATRPKIVAIEKIVKYFTIRMVLGIGTGNSSAVVSVVPSDRRSKRGALLGPKRHPNCQDRTSTGVFFWPLCVRIFFGGLIYGYVESKGALSMWMWRSHAEVPKLNSNTNLN